MSCPAFFTLLLPLRRRPGGTGTGRRHQAATPAPDSFTVLGFRPIEPSTSEYQSRIDEIRTQEEFPFTMAPSFDVNEDASPPRKKIRTCSETSKLHCRICYSDIDGPYVTPCRTCKKTVCFDCIRGQWLAALSDHERMPARCCDKVLYHDVAKDILPPAELAIYKLKYDEASTPNPFYCPVPTCSAFIPPRMLKPVRGKITCHMCATMSCFKCRQVASNDHKCSETDEKGTILKSFNYKLCPKCGTGIMRMFGCAHVRCQCGAHWCWDCQRPINACYLKPCSVARDDGQNSEVDDADMESGDEEGGSVREVTEADTDDNANRPIRSTAEQDENSDNAPAESSNGGSSRPISDATTVAETPQESTTATTDDQFSSRQNEQTTQPQDSFVNLDDPNDPDRDWEGEDYDFGDEPNDEYWDVWGCMHRFKDFTAENIPDGWLANLDTSKQMAIECMECFKTINIEGKKLAEEGPKTFEQWMNEQKQKAEAKPEGETEADAKAARKEKRKSKKAGAFECRDCGVIHCWWCRRAAIRRMTDYRKGAAA